MAALDGSRHTVIYLANPAIGARGIYQQIVAHLGGEPRSHKAALIPQCQELVARERAERGKQVVIILDEAHLLAADQLEELRLLTNAEMDSQSPFAGILLDQRIALRYEVPGMSATESAAYLAHHLALAGRSDPLFPDDATARLHQASRGVPRLLNNLATQALVAAHAARKSIIDESSARAAVAEVTAE